MESLNEANQLSPEEYQRLDAKVKASARDDGVDKMLREHNVDVIIGPADSYIPDVTALASKSLPFFFLF